MSKQHRFTSRTKARKRAADVVYEADQRGMGSNPDVLRDLAPPTWDCNCWNVKRACSKAATKICNPILLAKSICWNGN